MQVRDRVACICDNSPTKQGKEAGGMTVCQPERVFACHREAAYIVYNRFCAEICKQLADAGITNIHLLRK